MGPAISPDTRLIPIQQVAATVVAPRNPVVALNATSLRAIAVERGLGRGAQIFAGAVVIAELRKMPLKKSISAVANAY